MVGPPRWRGPGGAEGAARGGGGAGPPSATGGAAGVRAWHSLPPSATAAALGTDGVRGLDAAEAARRLSSHGPNRPVAPAERTRWRTMLDQFTGPLIGLLAVSAVLMLAIGKPADAAVIGAILALNGTLGYFQERRAADAVAALRRMTVDSARVRRGGVTLTVPAGELVPGDLVLVEAGDRIPADLRLVRAWDLRTSESALTGESEPVDKEAEAISPAGAPVADRRGMAWSGTTVVSGSAEAVAVATGEASEFGRIAALVREAREPETPLKTRLRSFGRSVALLAGAMVLVVFLLGLLRGVPMLEMALACVGLAVAAVPEGLPAVVTVALALGVARMARRNALVRHLPAVETLGCTTVIGADKTGTLTLGAMTVRAVATADGVLDVTGEGYGPGGRLLRGGEPAVVRAGDPAFETLRAGAAASTARLQEKDGAWSVAGDPTEGALLVAAAKAGVAVAALDGEIPVRSILPFDAARRRMSVVRRVGTGLVSYVKGAPESMLPRCVAVLGTGGERPMGGDDRRAVEEANRALAGHGLRVLAVARRVLEGSGATGAPGEVGESDLVLLGLVGMADPPRPGARAAVEACREAGVRTVMITGDQPATALAVARDLGIASGAAEVLAGAELEAMDDDALASRVGGVSVYARVSPEHKLRIVRAWQRRGAVVAMTGDGVNDAPALRGADIGVAMGRTGTDVARDAAAMVLADDDFASLAAAVEEGRRIFENVRKTLLYLLAGNLGEVLVMISAIVAGLPLPLLPLQILWVNLVTDGLPAMALAVDAIDPDQMRRPPRGRESGIADPEFLGTVAAAGALVAAATLAAFVFGLRTGSTPEHARSLAFSALVASQVLVAFAFRSRTRVLWELGGFSNAPLALVAAGTLALQFLVVQREPLASLLRAGGLSAGELAGVIVLGLVPVTALEVAKILHRALRAVPRPPPRD